MSPEERAELRRLAEAATPGPWEEQRHDDETCAGVDVLVATSVHVDPLPNTRGTLHTVHVVGCTACNSHDCPAMDPDDVAFIAAARSAIPALLDEVERLEAECARLIGIGCTPMPGDVAVHAMRAAQAEAEVERLRAWETKARDAMARLTEMDFDHFYFPSRAEYQYACIRDMRALLKEKP